MGVGVGPPPLLPPPHPAIIHKSNTLAEARANLRRADCLLNASRTQAPRAVTRKNNGAGPPAGSLKLEGADAPRDVVVMVTASVPDAASEGGLKLHVAPIGKPEQLKVTVPAAGPRVS